MNTERRADEEAAVGKGGITVIEIPNASIRYYLADRAGHTKKLSAAELVFDVSITLHRSIGEVWPIFKDFNLWMSRFGFIWDGIPADKENGFVFLGNRVGANDLKVGSDGTRTRYIVRKVIPERLIYL